MRRAALAAVAVVALLLFGRGERPPEMPAPAVAVASVAAVDEPVVVEVEQTFEFTGGVQYFAAPADVTLVEVEACGAAGADLVTLGGVADGGKGAKVRSVVALTWSRVLSVHVGGVGGEDGRGGWNGGGRAGLNPSAPVQAGGGGSSDVRRGGTDVEHRVVVAAGGGGGGWSYAEGLPGEPVTGGAGGGELGGGGEPDYLDFTFTGDGGNVWGGGLGMGDGGFGRAWLGGRGGPNGGAGGGGGLNGGGGGGFIDGEWKVFGAGGGGSSLADEADDGVCEGDGWVTIRYRTTLAPVVRPFGVLVDAEGDEGTSIWELPVLLTKPFAAEVSIDWATQAEIGIGLARQNRDFTAASGTLVWPPGETEAVIEIEVLGDIVDEPPLEWGEWGLVRFTDPQNASLDRESFYGRGLFIIQDDD